MKEFDLDIPLIGGDSVGNRSFAKLFEKFPLEKKYPGFYTNGIYAVTYFIYDVANEQAQQFKHQFNKLYNIDPGGAAVSNYDVAGIAIEAIRKANISGNNIKEDRKRIRDYLASINNTERSFKGLTGHIYFDPDGNAMKSMATGTFFKQKLISAPVQVNHIADFRTISALKRSEEERDDILQIDDAYLQLTKVVYTGSDIIDIKDIDPAKKTCSLDFYLWFRFQGALDTENFQFVNAAEPIKIENPINEKRTDQFIYRLYRLKGSFKIDFLPYTAADSNKHIIGFSLYHKKLPREKLIMVADTANMGAPGDNPLVKTMEGPHILNFPSDWSINDISCFQDIITKSALGDPDYLNADKGEMTFSRLTTRIDVTKRAFTLRGIMPLILALIVSILSGVFLALSLFWEKKERYTNHSKKIWIAQNLSVLLLIIGLETIILKSFAGTRDNYLPELITKAFDILWWLTYATILINAVKHFIWLPLEKRTKRSVPTFLRRFTKFVIYALAIFGITAFVFDQRITSLLATSGVVAMIIGLAIQMNISNVFSGIAINIELPFRINDWVKIGSLDEGKVIDITWRTTRIQTREDSILSIPNSVASESPVLNYCYPNNRYRTSLTVHMDPAHPFEHVQKIIREAIDSSEEILKEPAPIVSFAGFTDWSAAYFVGFHVDDYLKKPFYTSSVWKTIFKHFKREGIVPLAKFNQPQEMRLINDKE